MKRLQTIFLTLTLMTLFGCEGNGQTGKPGKPSDSKPAAKIGEQFTLKTDVKK